ncbi:16S rRNA (cytosine(967)-C(5))-methyltransferase RsmB [Salibacterium aidingense]|uniref:16S rRNA (cytosine(967)-C(5))-methyltransferase RsmB n=1 Tax=Salibacterium aidingense TaxID=384933 RepID=UPI0004067DB4|nr:16S rRNA (cytosine(967)-C(5))-methyltransferase RsmB [Salibacterium aidingense]
MSKKMFKNVREEALRMLERIEKEGAYSHLLLNHVLKEGTISDKDASLLTELVYGTIKRKNTLDYFIEPFVKKGTASLQSWVLQLLRLTVYQMEYLDRVPERAAVHEAVQIAKKKGHRGVSGLVNGVLRSIQREGIPSIDSRLPYLTSLALETSHPEWLLQEWTAAYGEVRTEAMARTNLEPPVLTVRLNRLKTDKESLLRQLEQEGCSVKAGNISPEAVLITSGDIFQTSAFQDGLCTVQDESSMLVARLLDPKPGMNVLDACAAPGGKTTHAAELMNNEGTLQAYDLHEKKVRLIETQTERLGITNVQAAALDARKLTTKHEPRTFDRVLVDAPCSGLGVIRRKPEVKWQKEKEEISRLPQIQSAVLQEAAELVKTEGRLVYSTCTLRQQENEEIVNSFLENNPSFERDKSACGCLPEMKDKTSENQLTIFPQDFHSDGFFMAALKRRY